MRAIIAGSALWLAVFAVSARAPAEDCGCVGATRTFRWGDAITESCTLNCDLEAVSNGTCFTVGTDGITIDGGGFTISGDGHYYGIDVTGRSNVTIRNIGISRFTSGINLADSSYIEISDSVISDNQWWTGIYLYNSDHCTISGNTMVGNGRGTNGRAILMGSASGTAITDNTLDASGNGIILSAAVDSTTIARNRVTNSQGDGIRLGAGVTGTVLEANTVCGSGDHDIENAGTSNTGDHNICGTTDGYDDPGAAGCTYGCAPPWIHDYDGNGTSDIAVFRGDSGMWSIRSLTRVYLGSAADEAVPDDYDGDGTTDAAVFREASGLWSVRDLTRFYLGAAPDQPVPGDYNGDGTAEGGIFRPAESLWSIRSLTRAYLGAANDLAVPGYYNDDEAMDIAVFREASGLWSALKLTRFYFGSSGDALVAGDYTGDRQWEGGIFRPATGLWSIRGVTRLYLGVTGDWALPGDYDGNGRDEAGIFRDWAGMWSVQNLTRVYFGATGDVPATR